MRSFAGQSYPLYAFRKGIQSHARFDANAYARKETITLSNDLTGVTLISQPIIRKDAPTPTHEGELSLLCAALSFIVHTPALFSNEVAYRATGKTDDQGKSPFWEGLGRNFVRRHHLAIATDKEERPNGYGIAELLPRNPIYVDLLSAECAECVGVADESESYRLAVLKSLGFNESSHIDFWDGGPVLSSSRYSVASMLKGGLSLSDARQKIESSEFSPEAAHAISGTSVDGFSVLFVEAEENVLNWRLLDAVAIASQWENASLTTLPKFPLPI